MSQLEPQSPFNRLLTLDLATRLGWAYGNVRDGNPVSGWHKLPVTGEDIGTFASAFHLWLIAMIKEADPDLIVFEEPMPTQAGRSTIATTLKLQGLAWHVEFVANMKGIECRQVHGGQWKKGFTGNGKASKAAAKKASAVYPVIASCRARGWDVADDNEADALGIFVYACSLVAPRQVSRFEPLARTGFQAA